MIEVAVAALMAVASESSLYELSCRGVPHYPGSKRVSLREGQVWQSVVDESFYSFVELDGVVGLIHYSTARSVDGSTFKGTATYVNTADWEHQSSPVECRVLK